MLEPELVDVKMTYRASATIPKAGETPEPEFPNLEGYLEKKGDVGVIKSWKKRYFCLKADRFDN
jgi:hypothetical protein